MIFQLLEIMKNIYIYIYIYIYIIYKEKRKKKSGADFERATAQLCFKEGDCVAILDFVLQRFRL